MRVLLWYLAGCLCFLTGTILAIVEKWRNP